jgi:DNA-binding NtrC family response regulator
MATIRVAQSKDWTQALMTVLSAAGHEVVTSSPADLAFAAVGESDQVDGAAAIVVAPLDQVGEAIARTKAGEAYAFIRYPLVSDEVLILLDRMLDHLRLANENRELRERLGQPMPANESGADPISVAKNLAGTPLATIEKQVILSTLEQFKGHRVKTATALGIGVRTLGMKLKRWKEEGEPIISRSTPRPPVHAGT